MTARNRSSPPVHQIKAIYEGFNNHPPPSPTRVPRSSSASTSQDADNTAIKGDRSEIALLGPEPPDEAADIIDTVIELQLPIRPEKAPSRPGIQQKPSWIGPLPPSYPLTPGISVMAQKVTVEYASHGLQPPVYITTSLSEPKWQVLEMQASKRPDGEYTFARQFEATEGHHQYKFRLGPGDWWACDESKPIVDDGCGNRNNLLVVQREEASVGNAPHSQRDSVKSTSDAAEGAKKDEAPATTVASLSSNPTEAAYSPPRPSDKQHTLQEPEHHEEQQNLRTAPSYAHEAIVPPPATEPSDPANDMMINPNQDEYEETQGDAPLLRHETLTLDSAEEQQAPLFRHESSFPNQSQDDDDQVGQAAEEIATSSPQQSASMISSPSLPSVTEEAEVDDRKVDEENNENIDSSIPAKDSAPAASVNKNAAPITPPLTPTDQGSFSHNIQLPHPDNHSHHHDHHHPKMALEDMNEEQELNELKLSDKDHHVHVSVESQVKTVGSKSGGLHDIRGSVSTLALVAGVAVLVALAWPYLFPHSDAVKDGGVTMGL